MSRKDIQNILIRLTDVTGYAFQDSRANAAFQTAINEIERLLAQERERVREMCDEGLSYMKDNLEVKEAEASAVTDGLYEKGRVSGLTIALGVIRGLDLTKDLAPSKETRRAEMFCNQCQGYVNVLAAPDHLKTHPEHTMRLRWYPSVDEGREEK